MTIKQISLFMENKPGRLAAACKILRDAKINIVTLSLADTQQFGIVRLIVEDWERAKDALEKAHFAVNVHDVIAASVRDEPGGMAELLDIVEALDVVRCNACLIELLLVVGSIVVSSSYTINESLADEFYSFAMANSIAMEPGYKYSRADAAERSMECDK